MTTLATRPLPTEHLEYYGKYIAMVPENEALAALENQMNDAMALLRTLTEAQGELRYAPEKWSIKEVIGHVCDGERVFAYRALRFARKDATPLPGFDENTYVPAGNFGRRLLADLIVEWDLIRRANLAFFRGLDAESWTRMGAANDSPVSVRALAFIIAGHGRHHMELIRTRYLTGASQ